MLKNDWQVENTKKWIAKFKWLLDNLVLTGDPTWDTLFQDSYGSQIESLEAEVAEYLEREICKEGGAR